MTEQPKGSEDKPLVTWRPLLLWSAAIVAFLALVWFVAAVAVPAYQVHEAIKEVEDYAPVIVPTRQSLDRLGGAQSAARKLGIYLRMPRSLICRGHDWDERAVAMFILSDCGEFGARPLIRGLRHAEPLMRKAAANNLGRIGPEAREAVPALIEALADTSMEIAQPANQTVIVEEQVSSEPVCGEAARALGRIGPDAEAAIPALTKLLDYPDDRVRKAAAEAIDRIRGKRTE